MFSALNYGIPITQSRLVRPEGSHQIHSPMVLRTKESFETEINGKIGPYPHYPKPISILGGLYHGSNCRIPGVQPLIFPVPKGLNQPFLQSLTRHCYEYGNTRFPPQCECGERYDCRSHVVGSGCSNCNKTCGTCNHNSNVIFY